MSRRASPYVAALVGFGRHLRRLGLPVGTNRVLTFCRACAALGELDRGALYWAGLSSLVAHPDHIEVYGRAFKDYFGRSRFEETLSEMFSRVPAPQPAEVDLLLAEESLEDAVGSDDPDRDDEVGGMIASRTEVLRHKSFEKLNEDERRHTDRLIRALRVKLPHRRSRRMRAAVRGSHFDMRRSLRASLRTQGQPLQRAWSRRRAKPRSLVLLLDVSGSMSPYARALLQFGFSVTAAGNLVEVFCFGTRLTRVTRALRAANPDHSLAEVARLVRDFEGGTRIGESLKRLLDDYSQNAALRGGVVVICSDGLERGDPALLATQMARLQRIAHRVVWVNPLKGSARYEPLARGMAAALPHADEFLEGHNVASLEALGAVLQRH